MPVDTQHPQYIKNAHKWALVRDCTEGSDTIRKRRETYLPKPNSEDDSLANARRYDAYINRAGFVNFTGMTLEGLLGMIYRIPVAVELQQSIAYIENNINGSGLTLDQMTRKMISNILQTARIGLLVDYPEAPEGLTRQQVDAMGLRANVLTYAAEDAINWDTMTIGGITMLSLVVLREPTKVPHDDGFGYEEKIYHRVLRLIDSAYLAVIMDDESLADSFDGYVYAQELYDDKNNLVSFSIPRKADKSTWAEIPFIFCGAQNNDPDVDKAPLYDIADINIGHYRNSADFEESAFMVGQPTPYATGLSTSWVKEALKGGVILGSRSFLMLPEGGSAGLIQATGNQMPERGMEMKEAQMVKMGARIIQDVKGNEREEAAKIRFAGQNSKLGLVIGNVESALMQCFEWAMEFVGGSGENSITINKQFYDKSIDPQLIMAQIQLLDRGVIAMTDIRDEMREGGIIDAQRTDEEIEGEAERQDVL